MHLSWSALRLFFLDIVFFCSRLRLHFFWFGWNSFVNILRRNWIEIETAAPVGYNCKLKRNNGVFCTCLYAKYDVVAVERCQFVVNLIGVFCGWMSFDVETNEESRFDSDKLIRDATENRQFTRFLLPMLGAQRCHRYASARAKVILCKRFRLLSWEWPVCVCAVAFPSPRHFHFLTFSLRMYAIVCTQHAMREYFSFQFGSFWCVTVHRKQFKCAHGYRWHRKSHLFDAREYQHQQLVQSTEK